MGPPIHSLDGVTPESVAHAQRSLEAAGERFGTADPELVQLRIDLQLSGQLGDGTGDDPDGQLLEDLLRNTSNFPYEMEHHQLLISFQMTRSPRDALNSVMDASRLGLHTRAWLDESIKLCDQLMQNPDVDTAAACREQMKSCAMVLQLYVRNRRADAAKYIRKLHAALTLFEHTVTAEGAALPPTNAPHSALLLAEYRAQYLAFAGG